MGTQKNKATLKDFIVHGIYFNLYGLFKYFPSPIGDFLRYWTTKPFIKKMGKVKIAEGVTIGYPYNISIGSNVTLNNGVTLDGFGGLSIGDNTRIAHRATILSSDHITENNSIPIFQQGLKAKHTIIEEDCWLGCNSVILPGVSLKKGSIIAANAVVTINTAPYMIYGGIPAKEIKRRG